MTEFERATNRNKGTCNNRMTLRLDRLEEAVPSSLQERLVTPELAAEFVREHTSARSTGFAPKRRRSMLGHGIGWRLKKQIVHIADAVAAGRASSALLDRLEKLELEEENLKVELAAPTPTPIRLHPNITECFVEKVADLRRALNR